MNKDFDCTKCKISIGCSKVIYADEDNDPICDGVNEYIKRIKSQ